MNKLISTPLMLCSIFLVHTQVLANNESEPLTLNKAIQLAWQNDPWLVGNKHQQKALELRSDAESTLDDPKISMAFANLPTNGFDLQQEAMTQFKLGISQQFSRGDSLSIKQQQLRFEAEQYPLMRADRKAKVAVKVGQLWLDLFRVKQSIILIEENRNLFEKLGQIAEASYGSGVGKSRQQDIVRAQLELTRLEDKLYQLSEQQGSFRGRLLPWLVNTSLESQLNAPINLSSSVILSNALPTIDLLVDASFLNENYMNEKKTTNYLLEHSFNQAINQELVEHFTRHPAVKAIDKQVNVSEATTALAQQKYQPQWGVNASYGYRDDDPYGQSRADLFSVGVTFDLPLFTQNKQDKAVMSAHAQTESVKTQKQLLIREMLTGFFSAKERLARLNQRLDLYKEKLLPQIHDQAQASLTAYTNEAGDFAEVVRARIAVLTAQLEQLSIEVAKQKIILDVNYFFIGTLPIESTQSVSQLNSKGEHYDK
ncbi:TolC family protein [Colwellia sp. RSH04]|uniref:TolC family protein n=1 Tax=Colwellia sp. RSH04 TaxID=2305464 RepID=UPI000E56C4B7|nr:TolC family protein [Colwellia sp. RSH04]RHW77601.1 TolC family protein [Colwellia sp. RSH04]